MYDTSQPRFMVTAKLEVKYRKNVPIGRPLRIVGKTVKTKGRLAEGWAGIYDETGTLLAECKTLLVNIPAEMTNNVDPEALGWKIYPD
jgi:acyl-CoA thioesterase FadM